MDFIKRMLGMVTSKAFKIQNGSGKGRVGITASSLNDLKHKGEHKLKMKKPYRLVLEEDGTEICDNEYFKSLPSQTVVVFLNAEEEWDGYISYLKLAGDKLVKNISSRQDTVDRIQFLLRNPNSPELALMMDYVNTVHSNIDAELRVEDPDWFIGLPQNIQCKSKAMRDSMKGRVRGYMWKTKEFLANSRISSKDFRCQEILSQFKNQLKEDLHHSDCFDRTAQEEDRLCNERGWFNCQGAFNKENCKQVHTINPYGSKDSRVLFSTWNLDHRVEKTRVILPSLVRAIEECPKNKAVNWRYFYSLLFTRENLKLVDIRCHAKEKHSNYLIDRKKIYL